LISVTDFTIRRIPDNGKREFPNAGAFRSDTEGGIALRGRSLKKMVKLKLELKKVVTCY